MVCEGEYCRVLNRSNTLSVESEVDKKEYRKVVYGVVAKAGFRSSLGPFSFLLGIKGKQE